MVKELSFTDAGVEVAFKIDEAAAQRIPVDVKVKLGSDGLIGNKILLLYGGTEYSAKITAGAILTVAEAEGVDAMLATLQENNKNLLQITADFKKVSGGMVNGNGAIGKLLTNETLANSLEGTILTLNKASSHTQQLTANLSGFTARLNRRGSLTADLLTDTSIFASLKATAMQVRQIALTTNKVVNDPSQTTQ